MLRLFKLAAYAFFGYALYEFFRGLTADIERVPVVHRRPMSDDLRHSLEEEIRHLKSERRAQQEQQGMKTPTESYDGGRQSYAVGRGVVNR